MHKEIDKNSLQEVIQGMHVLKNLTTEKLNNEDKGFTSFIPNDTGFSLSYLYDRQPPLAVYINYYKGEDDVISSFHITFSINFTEKVDVRFEGEYWNMDNPAHDKYADMTRKIFGHIINKLSFIINKEDYVARVFSDVINDIELE